MLYLRYIDAMFIIRKGKCRYLKKILEGFKEKASEQTVIVVIVVVIMLIMFNITTNINIKFTKMAKLQW